MKKTLLIGIFSLIILTSCNKEKKMMDALNTYNTEMETKGYHFGDKINFPKEVTDNAESISISFGDKETSDLVIDPKFFTLGDNMVTINIVKDGKTLNQDATINVFAKNPEANLTYELVKDYPHDTNNFTEGFYLDGNTIYESVGLEGKSKLMKYTLGTTKNLIEVKQPDNIFSEGISSIGNKLFQLTYRTKIGFIYDKSTFKKLGEFTFPNVIGEGWGMTTDGKDLIVSDGTKNIYFLNPENPSQIKRYISVAGNNEVYDNINELEYHNGFIYSNVWQKPFILKIDPKTGEVVGKFDFSLLTKQNTTDEDNVLNGIAFKGDNMLVTGKNWDKIYEVKIK